MEIDEEKIPSEEDAKGLSNRQRAVGYVCLYCVLASMYQALAKQATMSDGIHVMDLVFVRVSVNFITSWGTVYYGGKHLINDVPKKFVKILLVRCLLGTVGYASFIYCLKYVPLFICTIIMNTAPFMASALGYVVNKDHITRNELVLMFGAFIGVVLLALTKGGIIGTGIQEVEESQDGPKVSKGQYILAMAILCAQPFMFASIAVITRKLKEIHFSLMMFHYGAFATFFCFIWITTEYFTSTNYQTVSPECVSIRFFCYSSYQWTILLGIALLNASSMNFMTIAGQLDKSAFITSILQIMIVYALFIDITYFKTKFEVMELVAAGIIVFFSALLVGSKLKNEKSEK